MSYLLKRTVTGKGKRIFFQTSGKGPALALFHASPFSSDMLLPFAQQLSSYFTVFCIDTPGYGRSDGFDAPPKDLSAYSELLPEFFDHLGIEKLSIYGSATGAQLAVRFALDYPERVNQVYLDNAAHFNSELRAQILEHYFPDLTPRLDGSHLDTVWDIASNLFLYFPWCFKTEKFALNRPQLPPAALHGIALTYLDAGEKYHYAYRVAFMHEKAEHAQALKVPTTIFRWDESIILPYIDALLDHELPDHVKPKRLQGQNEERFQGMVAHMKQQHAQDEPFIFDADLGQAYVAPSKTALDVMLPEAVENGKHLHNAWALLREHSPEASAEEIQQLLLLGYKKQTT